MYDFRKSKVKTLFRLYLYTYFYKSYKSYTFVLYALCFNIITIVTVRRALKFVMYFPFTILVLTSLKIAKYRPKHVAYL